MATVNQLVKMTQDYAAEVEHFASLVPDARRQEFGQADAWAIKDHLTHLGAWQLYMIEEIRASESGAPARSTANDNVDAANQAQFEKYRHLNWAQAVAMAQQAAKALAECVAGLTDERLLSPLQAGDEQARPLWRQIAGNSYLHPVAHLFPLYLELGHEHDADRLRQKENEWVQALDDSPEWRGIGYYNMACYAALRGMGGVALEYLRLGIGLFPGLKEYAPQDGDLESLRHDPEFLELIA